MPCFQSFKGFSVVPKYRYEYFHGGLNSIVREWINSGCQEKPQLLAEFLHKEFGMKTAAKNI
jgi:hypothetical protein